MKGLTVFHQDIKSILERARSKTRSAINSAMVEAYWLIGQRIVEEEQQGDVKAKYGQRLLENLSVELSAIFGKGFSYANLRNFRQFYLTYPDQEICYTLCSKLSWSHNRLIMRVDNYEARNYYLKEVISQQWSVRQLERNIKSLSYQRLLSSQSAHVQSRQPVKYSVIKESQQLFASKYQRILPTEEELTAEIAREKRLIREATRDE
ncbi:MULTISPECIES: DUF1016 N-terminal domain-containing protein [Cysteiniphilum]|uniref:YhcG N-terminal domain-containing protein n=1 Tax=Cysteiniphilum litorale TaxID=2056700 RepID=A0A8J2Z414_9GAMM|nr:MULTISPECIES: DUF1016 N-terminal domain-containing protein [Cysteiniphilum]GGF96043.1 hypothetical protein GCM10010995_11630 [Cysteiniphilum litorale]